MKNNNISEVDIMGILIKLELGVDQKYISKEYGISVDDVISWKEKYENFKLDTVQKIEALEEENIKLNKLLTNIRYTIKGMLDKTA